MRSAHTYLMLVTVLAFTFVPNISIAQEILFGALGNGSPVNPGGIIVINQNNAAGVFIGDGVTPGGLNGIDFDSTGRLFGSIIEGNGSASTLVEIDPNSGAIINNIGPIVDGVGTPLSMGDLAIQPGTDVLYAISSNNISLGGLLYTINKSTAVATFVGTVTDRACGLGFAPDGTLYCWEGNNDGLHVIDPNTGLVIDNIPTDSDFIDAMAVRSDGLIFGALCGGCTNPDTIVTVNPATGIVNVIGDSGQGSVSDLAFTSIIASNVPTLSQWGLLATAAVLGFIGFMFIRRRKTVV